MYYITKWDFLESIGKDRRDVRLVDRMVKRWEVLHNERGYSLTKDAYREAYEWELERFKKEKAELVKRIDELENGSSDDGMYYIEDKDARIAELEKEVEKLRSENVTKKGSNWEDERSKNATQGNNVLLEKVASLESDVNYLNGEYEKMEAKLINYQEAIKNCYRRARDVKKDRTPWPTFKKDILKLEEDVRWEDNQ